MPVPYRDIIIESFQNLDQRIIWKFESDLEDIPKNVMVDKWFPQQDILGHPNVKVFITHGGKLSLQEAVYHGTPLLALPIFGDQANNAMKMSSSGWGLFMMWEELTVEGLVSSLQKIINNPKYRSKVKTTSTLMKDQISKLVDRAVWWTECVIKHKGAPKLRPPTAELSWIEFLFLDGIAMVLSSIVFTLCLLRWVFRKFIHTVFSKTNKRKMEWSSIICCKENIDLLIPKVLYPHSKLFAKKDKDI